MFQLTMKKEYFILNLFQLRNFRLQRGLDCILQYLIQQVLIIRHGYTQLDLHIRLV
jgi:hypothetical protein